MWVELNIPWTDRTFPDTPSPYAELASAWPRNAERLAYRDAAEKPLTESDPHSTISWDVDNLFKRCNELVEQYEETNGVDTNTAREAIYAQHPEFEPVKMYRQLTREQDAWIDSHPKHIEYRRQYEAALAEIKQRSFCGRELNKPGTVVEIEDQGKTKTLIIGHINPLGGVCDDCSEFDGDAQNVIVKRYKVLCV